jgi:putative serine protease PepD
MIAAGATGAVVATGALAMAGFLGSGGSEPDNPPPPVAVLAARAAPAVVAVFATGAAGERRGSGVVIADDWVLATCDTVGDDTPTAITITSADGTVHPATIRGLDPVTDLALLHVDGVDGELAARTERPVEVGEPVIAVGSGDASQSWVATGVVSSTAMMATGGPTVRAGLIATDALMETGTSGGVLLDRAGRAVGVLTSGSDRAGVAVPIATARDVAEQLRTTGKAGHGWIGVSGVDAVDRAGGGVRVTEVNGAGPAAGAGIRLDDVIVAIESSRVTRMADLIAAVRDHHPGDEVTLRLLRDSTTRTVTITLHDISEAPSPVTSTTLVEAAAG